LYKTTVQNIQSWNKLPGTEIEVGQILVVGYKNIIVASSDTSATTNLSFDEPDMNGQDEIDDRYKAQYSKGQQELNEKRINGQLTAKVIDEKTTASYIDDGSIVTNKMLALHSTAPPGTIVKVTNLLTGKYIFVQVIGKLPPGTGEEANVTIKLTKTAAEQIGALDKYFRVALHYTLETPK
nr:LysM peptidoglycan-binding domain-containing protein [Bacteroidota bacterium]